ncbi:MAG TPA: lamin tail domain-containing protein [Pyrinomonadaceae bacterium]
MRTKAHAPGRAPRAARRLVLVALLSALACAALLPHAARPGASAQVRPRRKVLTPDAPARTVGRTPARKPGGGTTATTPQPQPQPQQPEPVTTTRVRPVTVANVNFRQLAAQQARAARTALGRPPERYQAIHPPLTIDDSTQGGARRPRAGEAARQPAPFALDDPGGPLAPSPSPSSTYNAQEDGPKVDGPSAGLFNIPPDTQGAVGLDKVFTNTNPNYRVHDKTTGAPLSTVSTDTFWAASGGSGFFDPRIVFDPYNLRWILAIASNAQTANSSVIIAVSQTPDPQGSYNVYRFVVGCAGGAQGCDSLGEWADFPMLGFNKNWIAVSMNMFGLPNGSPHVNDKILVLDYPQARSGAANTYLFSGDAIGFCNHPVETYDAAEATLYFAQHLSSADAAYKISTVTGEPPAQPALNFGEEKVRPGGGWTQPVGDMLPQTCVGAAGVNCPTTVRRIDALDAQVRGNAVFRNGGIYYAQTIALPAGAGQTTDPFGHQVSTADRTAAQWTRLDTSGNFVEGGRIEDAAATPTNGGRWYAYPSIAVNKHNDVLVGFSEFESDDFVDAGYAVRLGTDAPGAMRDPVVYKEGEDYYSKDFFGTRNRFGDYSATRIDPVNDRDIWTVQEYAGTRTAANNLSTTNNSRWGTWWAKVALPAAAGELIISEFRLRGPNGANDEFVEIYNASGSAHAVTTADGSAGYAVAAEDNAVRCVIPNGTVIPARGHFLCANSSGYSLGGHPAGGVTNATPDAAYTADIPDNSGVALFNTATPASFSTATRVDAVGFTTTPPGAYVEGTGLAALVAADVDHSHYRDACGKGGSVTALGNCPTAGLPKDTNDNAADFVFVEVNGNSIGAGQRLGAPGPENLSSPVQRNSQIAGTNIDPAVGSSNPPNRVRDFTSNPGNNSTFGTLSIRKTITNNTGGPVTRLRFRVIDITTFPTPAGVADLRPRTSGPAVAVITGTNAACPSGTCAVQGTTLEQPPAQPDGGGFNSALSAGTVTLAQPLAAGASVNVQFLLGIQQTGTFKFFINVEVLP